MEISTILNHIDNGHMALPEFQRGYVWNRDQIRGLFNSLYRKHPVGGLLVWVTQSRTAAHRGEGELAPGVVKLLLDGQQRITSLYGVLRGKPPQFFDGNPTIFEGLHFHMEDEIFQFYRASKMKDDPLWISVTELMKGGSSGMGAFVAELPPEKLGIYVGRLGRLLGIADVNLHVEEITGEDMTLDVVVDIFNRVNSGGTKLSKGDLALAKICAGWPDGRNAMRDKLQEWEQQGFHFTLDWLLRSVNTVLTGEARFLYLHDRGTEEIQDALKRANKHIDFLLNLISGRLGLDHNRVLFGRFAIPVMARYLDQRESGPLDEKERDKLLFWYVQAAMWGRFSGSTESFIDKDLEALEGDNGGLDQLLDQLRLWHGGLQVEAGHFTGWSKGARFYPVLYLLTRTGQARDWGNGLPLKANLLGKMSRLEVHHIFPRAQLYKRDYSRAEVNALANYCFLTKDTNLNISATLPEIYFEQVEANHPGALASQWVPMDKQLWRVENYLDFLEARKQLLAAELNSLMRDLLHGDGRWLDDARRSASSPEIHTGSQPEIPGGISSEEEEQELEELNAWVQSHGLPAGELAFDYADLKTGEQKAVFDLVWSRGLQQDLSAPVSVLLNEEAAVISLASQAGFKCFTTADSFKKYVTEEILALEA